jgi:hypothetical protein
MHPGVRLAPHAVPGTTSAVAPAFQDGERRFIPVFSRMSSLDSVASPTAWGVGLG